MQTCLAFNLTRTQNGIICHPLFFKNTERLTNFPACKSYSIPFSTAKIYVWQSKSSKQEDLVKRKVIDKRTKQKRTRQQKKGKIYERGGVKWKRRAYLFLREALTPSVGSSIWDGQDNMLASGHPPMKIWIPFLLGKLICRTRASSYLARFTNPIFQKKWGLGTWLALTSSVGSSIWDGQDNMLASHPPMKIWIHFVLPKEVRFPLASGQTPMKIWSYILRELE